MKKSILFSIIFLVLSLQNLLAQPKRTLVIYELKNTDGLKSITFYENQIIHVDSSGSDTGYFFYKTPEPVRVTYCINDERDKCNMFYVYGDTITIIINGTDVSNEVLNSKLNDDAKKFLQLRRSYNTLVNPLLNSLPNEVYNRDTANVYEKPYNDINYLYSIHNPASYIALKTLAFWLKSDFKEDYKIKHLYNILDTSLYDFPTYRLCKKAMKDYDKRKPYFIGDVIDNVKLQNEKEQIVHLKQLLKNKKYTYLHFWACNYSFSEQTTELFLKLQKKHGKQFQLININYLYEDVQKWKSRFREDGIKRIDLRSEIYGFDYFFHQINVWQYPRGVLINNKGKIIALAISPEQLEDFLDGRNK